MAKVRVGVLVSGTGSLLQAILDGRDELFEVSVVASDRPDIQALTRAEAAGVPGVVIPWSDYGKAARPEFSKAIGDAVRGHGVDLALNAGFMRILTQEYFEAVGVPCLNSHPALLPSFPGAHGVRDALAHGVKVTGTTIHFADVAVDGGPIVVQEAVPVEEGDTEGTLHERIKAVEQRLYPDVIRLFAQGRLKVEGRRVHVLPAPG